MFDKDALRSLQVTLASLKEQGTLTPLMTLEALKKSVNAVQRQIIEQVIKLNPRDYNVDLPYAGDLEPVPTDLEVVRNQHYFNGANRKVLDDVYVPRHIYENYLRMNDVFKSVCADRSLLIGACYRSPAYQVVVFINWLTNTYDGDVSQAIRHVSPPSYSQHTIASKAAIDFQTIDGAPSDHHPEKFRETSEYVWLSERALDFGFFESWPEGNRFGMRAEPWHWQFLGKRNAD